MNKKIVFVAYCKDKVKILTGFFMITFIYTAVTMLYQMENTVDALLYVSTILFFLILCYGIYDFYCYYRKCKKLEEAFLKQGERDFFLPDEKTFPETIYQNIVKQEEEEKRELTLEMDTSQRDMQDYYAMWTHQIKTPIAAMKLLLEKESREQFAQQEELFKIEQYVEMALQYSRLLSESSDMILKEVDIREMIRQSVKKYSLLYINKNISLHIEAFQCNVITDEKWVSFVVEQLLSNAVKYTVKGSVRIYAISDHQIVIEDSGIGIPPEDIPRIFEKGFTGYNGRISKKSTGIGLYLSKQIFIKLSHSIRVESELGVGTKMILDFVQRETM